ncbi:MAG: CDP-glycerol glycerophosphotransferase family protein [Acutalibacteraceae bacterium]|jgi:CDP-glycerol glycerophosphotransferase
MQQRERIVTNRQTLKSKIAACRPLFSLAYALRRAQQRFLLWLAARRHPLDRRLVLFDSFQSNHYNDSPKALYQALIAVYPDKRAVWVLRRPDAMRETPDLPRTEIVLYDTPAYRRAMVTAGTVVTNSMTPPFWRPRRGQTLIQTWHGTPLKRLGCDLTVGGNALDTLRQTHRRYRRQGRLMNRLLSPSVYCTDKLSSAFGLTAAQRAAKVIETGYPRNDRLSTATPDEIAALRKKLDLPLDKKVILYAPTYRDDQRQGQDFVYTPPEGFDRLVEALGDTAIILFRAHYFVSNALDFTRYAGKVRRADEVEDINELYLCSDLLITDYSSVFFDYALLRRPIVLYMYDLESYRDELRNFYLDVSELPFPVVRTADELIGQVRHALADFAPGAEYTAFLDRFAPHEDGDASRRVWKAIWPENPPAV